MSKNLNIHELMILLPLFYKILTLICLMIADNWIFFHSINSNPLKAQEILQLSKKLQQLYKTIFNTVSIEIHLQNFIPIPKTQNPFPSCERYMLDNEKYFKCFDCEVKSSAICKKCFEKGNHKGHHFIKKTARAGYTCDCGDPSYVKPQGFCVNHSGKLQQIAISQEQRSEFLQVFSHLFRWYLRLKGKQNFIMCGKTIFMFLQNLMNENLFYYRLATELFMKKQKIENEQTTILQICLNLQMHENTKLIQKILIKLRLYEDFNEFMVKKIGSFYSQYEKQQVNKYNDLIWHTFSSNESIIKKLLKNNDQEFVVFRPKGKVFQMKLLSVIFHKLQAFQKETVILYLQKFFLHEIMYFPHYQFIEQFVQDEGQSIVQVFDDEFFMDQLRFFNRYKQILHKIKGQSKLLVCIIKNIMKQISSHRFVKNTIVLNYQRILGCFIFTFFQGNIQDISLVKLSELLQKQTHEVQEFMRINSKRILICILQFATTFSKNSYFKIYESYLSTPFLYQYDFLFLRIAANIVNLSEIIQEIFIKSLSSVHQNTLLEEFQKWVSFIALISQIICSNKTDIIFNSKLKINNQKIKKEQRQMVQSFLLMASPIPEKSMKKTKLFFLNELAQEAYFQHLTFDEDRKLFIKNEKMEEIYPFCYHYYYSFSNMVYYLNTKENLKTGKPILNEKNEKISKSLNLNNLLKNLQNEIISEIASSETQGKQYLSLTKKFINELQKLKEFHTYNKEQINTIVNSLEICFKKEEGKQIKSQSLKVKREKLLKMKEKQKKFIENLEIQEQQEFADKQLCIICKQEDQKVFHLSYLLTTNLFNLKLKAKDNTFYFGGCGHLIHLKCFENLNKDKCPLCQGYINILLPRANEKYEIEVMTDLIVKIKQKMGQNPNFGEILNEFIFRKLLNSLEQVIGIQGILDSRYSESSFLGKSLFLLLEVLWKNTKKLKKYLLKQIKSEDKVQQKSLNNEGKNQEQQNGEKDIFKKIKICIFSIFLKKLKEEEINIEEIYKEFTGQINHNDLFNLLKSIIVSFNLPQSFLQTLKEIKSEEFQVKKVSEMYSHFEPPQTIFQLYKIRDNIKVKCKSTIHSVLVCVLCKEGFCAECKQFQIHTIEKHGGQMLYLSTLDGSLSYYRDGYHFPVNNLYKNKFREKWRPNLKNSEQFFVSRQVYHRYVKKFLSHRIIDKIYEQS